jgi:hypothetical protein
MGDEAKFLETVRKRDGSVARCRDCGWLKPITYRGEKMWRCAAKAIFIEDDIFTACREFFMEKID